MLSIGFAMITAAATLSVAGAAERPTDVLGLRLNAAKGPLLVGQPTKLVLDWTATRAIEVNPDGARLLIDAGAGFQPYSEARVATGPAWLTLPEVGPGKPMRTTYVIAASGELSTTGAKSFRFAFPQAGRYLVKVRYEDGTPTGQRDGVDSNVVMLDVETPKGRDAELFTKYFRLRPELFTEWAFLEENDVRFLQSLEEHYRGSPYLESVSLELWKHRLGRSHKAAEGIAEGVPTTEDILREMEETPLGTGLFDEDRLLMIGQGRASIGDRAGAKAAYEEILAKYPNGGQSPTAKQWLDDEARMEATQAEFEARIKSPKP